MSKPSGAIDMTQGKPINLMLRFALPMMIGSIFQSLYSMVDSAVLGRFVGSHALAAIGATTSTTGLILLLATGVTSAISGSKEKGELGKLLKSIGDDVPQYIGKPDSLDSAIRCHSRVQVERILKNPLIEEKVKDGSLFVKSGFYDIHTGRVTID